MSNITKTAMITVCGRPNVGKSSLTNALVGEKVAIVSNKAQTTRNRIYGIVNREDTQYILLDTPGLHKPKSALGDYMVKVVTSSLSDVDCALLLVEPIPHVGGPEKALIDRIREEKIPCILCINKIDTVEPAELLPVIAAYNEVWDGFDAIIPISAHKGGGLDDLMHELQKYAQEGPQLFPDGETTDQPERAKLALEALEDKKAMDVRILDITHVSTLADYFMIASGSNRNQVQAMADNVEEVLGKAGVHPKQIEGYQTANWILMDYGDVVIHIFDEENRLFYDLERIWRDGKVVEKEEIM